MFPIDFADLLSFLEKWLYQFYSMSHASAGKHFNVSSLQDLSWLSSTFPELPAVFLDPCERELKEPLVKGFSPLEKGHGQWGERWL